MTNVTVTNFLTQIEDRDREKVPLPKLDPEAQGVKAP